MSPYPTKKSMSCVNLLIIGDGYATGSFLLGIQYEHNGSFNRHSCYVRQTDKKDTKKNSGISLVSSFSEDDSSCGVE